MHILTKFLVVIAVILSILLSGLSIALTGNIDAIRDDHSRMKSAVSVAEGEAMQAASALGELRTQYENERVQKDAQLSQSRQNLDRLSGENKRLQVEVKRLELSEASYASRIDQFTALIDAHVKLAEARAAELAVLRKNELAYARKEIELADRINDLEGELDVSRETARSLQEQIAAMRDGGGDAVARGGIPGMGGEGEIRAPQNLRAHVTDVRPDADGTLLVSIDAGSSDRLRGRMKLNIVRGGAYVGSIVLDVVDLNESIGRVVLLKDSDNSVRQGDLILPSEL